VVLVLCELLLELSLCEPLLFSLMLEAVLEPSSYLYVITTVWPWFRSLDWALDLPFNLMLALSLSLKVIVLPCPSTVIVLLLLSTLRICPVKVELLVELAVPDFAVAAAPAESLELEFKLLLDVLL
jgi:hypothetical protein